MRAGALLCLPLPSPKALCFLPFSSRTQTKPRFQRLSLEDLGLWAFGMGGDVTKLGKVPSPGVQWAGAEGWVALAPGPWPGWTWSEEPCTCCPPSRGKPVSSCYGRKGLGLPPPAAPLAGAVALLLGPTLEPAPPCCDSPSKGQQAASSELRDNSLLEAGRAGRWPRRHSWLARPHTLPPPACYLLCQ